MTDQIIIQLDDHENTITYDEWRGFVENRRGKWRGVASDEGVQALRDYVDRHSGDTAEESSEDDEVEQLKDEIDRLTTENERLSEENERLHAMLGEESTPTPSPRSGGSKTKNGSEGVSKSTNEFDGYSRRTDETDEAGVWSWTDYDADDDDATVPKSALDQLPDEFDVVNDPLDFAGRELPAVNPDHIEDLPRSANARAATVAAVARHRADVMDEGELVATAMDVLDNQTKWYVRGTIVTGDNDDGPETAVMDWLAGRHPSDDVQVVTGVDAYESVWYSVESERQNDYERAVEKYVGVAMGDARHYYSFSTLPRTDKRYLDEWRQMEAKNREELHPLAHDVIENALLAVATGGTPTFAVHVNESEEDDEQASAIEMVTWWDEKERDGEMADKDRRQIAESIEEYVPDERLSWEEARQQEEQKEKKNDELEWIEAAE